MLACSREGLEKQLVEWVKSDDEKTRDRMMKNAQAVANRGMDAVLALMARGVGESHLPEVDAKGSERGLRGFTGSNSHIAEIGNKNSPILGLIRV